MSKWTFEKKIVSHNDYPKTIILQVMFAILLISYRIRTNIYSISYLTKVILMHPLYIHCESKVLNKLHGTLCGGKLVCP